MHFFSFRNATEIHSDNIFLASYPPWNWIVSNPEFEFSIEKFEFLSYFSSFGQKMGSKCSSRSEFVTVSCLISHIDEINKEIHQKIKFDHFQKPKMQKPQSITTMMTV